MAMEISMVMTIEFWVAQLRVHPGRQQLDLADLNCDGPMSNSLETVEAASWISQSSDLELHNFHYHQAMCGSIPACYLLIEGACCVQVSFPTPHLQPSCGTGPALLTIQAYSYRSGTRQPDPKLLLPTE